MRIQAFLTAAAINLKRLATALLLLWRLVAATSPGVGGIGGGTRNWADYFAKTPGSEEKAIEILRQVTADFDRAHGTSITPKLEKALESAGKGKPSP